MRFFFFFVFFSFFLFFCAKLRYGTAFDVVDSVLLRLSHYVTVITAREV